MRNMTRLGEPGSSHYLRADFALLLDADFASFRMGI